MRAWSDCSSCSTLPLSACTVKTLWRVQEACDGQQGTFVALTGGGLKADSSELAAGRGYSTDAVVGIERTRALPPAHSR